MKVEGRRWEDLEHNCLAYVFTKVGLESLLLAVPFVCKSWYAATLNPISWQCLKFPACKPSPLFTDNIYDRTKPPESFGPFYDQFIEQYGIDRRRFSITTLVKLVVDRSKGTALALKLPEFFPEEALRYVSVNCPVLRNLWLSDDLVLFKLSNVVLEMIGKWKYLERLILGGSLRYIMKQRDSSHPSKKYLSKHFDELLNSKLPLNYDVLNEILVQLGPHCKRLNCLKIINASLGEVEASVIVNLLPKLKLLVARECRVERDCVVTLLRGCKELVKFELRHYGGFEQGDEEILKLASRVKLFSCHKCVSRNLLGLYYVKISRTFICFKSRLSQILERIRNLRTQNNEFYM